MEKKYNKPFASDYKTDEMIKAKKDRKKLDMILDMTVIGSFLLLGSFTYYLIFEHSSVMYR